MKLTKEQEKELSDMVDIFYARIKNSDEETRELLINAIYLISKLSQFYDELTMLKEKGGDKV